MFLDKDASMPVYELWFSISWLKSDMNNILLHRLYENCAQPESTGEDTQFSSALEFRESPTVPAGFL